MRPRKRTLGIDAATRERLSWLFERLDRIDPDQRPSVPGLLDRIDRRRWPEVVEILLDARSLERMQPPVESMRTHERELRARIRDLEACLRAVRQARRVLGRDHRSMFVDAALEEVDAELRDDIAGDKSLVAPPGAVHFGSGIAPVYVPRGKPKRGAPAKYTNALLERLRGCGAPRDTARELLRAVRLAARVPLPRPPGMKTFKRPSFIELALAREENKRTRAADGFFGWAHRYPEFAPPRFAPPRNT